MSGDIRLNLQRVVSVKPHLSIETATVLAELVFVPLLKCITTSRANDAGDDVPKTSVLFPCK
jgi:hypothetical protein